MVDVHSGSTQGWEGAMLEIGSGGIGASGGRRGAVRAAEIAAVIVAAALVAALVL